MNSYYQLDTHLTANADPASPMHVVTKRYIDQKVQSVDGAHFNSGTISVSKLPAFTGDITTSPGDNTVILGTGGAVAGTYNSFTVDGKGRVLNGTYTDAPTGALSWNVVKDKPTTLAGYGITDVVKSTGDTVATMIMSGTQSTASNAALTMGALETKISQAPSSGLKTGEVLRTSQYLTPPGFLRASGGILDRANYPNLYAAIGDAFGTVSTGSSAYVGLPWREQSSFNFDANSSTATWSAGTNLPVALWWSAAAVTKNRAFLMGGVLSNLTYTSNMYTAPINADGSLGAWTASGTLPSARCGHLVVASKTRLYLIGGALNASTFTANVYYATINADGTLGAWTAAPSLPAAQCGMATVMTKNRIYVMGGMQAGGYVNSVYSAPVDDAGVIGTWVTETSLPGILHGSQAIVTKNRVYMLGGATSYSTHVNTVYTAPINEDGTIGAWTTGTSLPANIAFAQAITTKNQVYLIGGAGSSSGAYPSVYIAPINADGTLGTWYGGLGLTTGVAYGQAIVTSSRICMMGGYNPSGTALAATVYRSFTGGSNDYLAVTDMTSSDPTKFRLPDYTNKQTDWLFFYIKY